MCKAAAKLADCLCDVADLAHVVAPQPRPCGPPCSDLIVQRVPDKVAFQAQVDGLQPERTYKVSVIAFLRDRDMVAGPASSILVSVSGGSEADAASAPTGTLSQKA